MVSAFRRQSTDIYTRLMEQYLTIHAMGRRTGIIKFMEYWRYKALLPARIVFVA
jgi:hypothetical protein